MKKKVVEPKEKSFINKLWSTDGDVSSKRFVSLIGFTLLAIAFAINIFKEVKLKEFIWDGMLWVVLGGLGLTVAEKFNYKSKANSVATSTEPQPDDEEDTDKDTPINNNDIKSTKKTEATTEIKAVDPGTE